VLITNLLRGAQAQHLARIGASNLKRQPLQPTFLAYEALLKLNTRSAHLFRIKYGWTF
jgi:hypothetical protein